MRRITPWPPFGTKGTQRLRPLGIAVFGLIVGVAVFPLARSAASPWSQISSSATVALLSTTCGGCVAAFDVMLGDPDNYSHVVPVPIDNADTEFWRRICTTAIERVDESSTAIWSSRLSSYLRAGIPKSLRCTWLTLDAADFYDEHGFLSVPQFIVAGEAIDSATFFDSPR